MFHLRFVCLLIATFFFSELNAQLRFETDFNTEEVGSSPSWVTTVGNRIFFSADDGLNGREPWVYSPSAGEAFLLKDINEYGEGSDPREVTVVDDAAYFIANVGLEQQLWVLKNNSNTVIQIPTDVMLSEIQSLTQYEEAIYFRAKHLGDNSGDIFLYRYLLTDEVVEEVVNTSSDFNLSSPFNAMEVHNGALYLQGFLFSTATQVLLRYSDDTGDFELVENQYSANGDFIGITDFRSVGDYLVMNIRSPFSPNTAHFGFYETGIDSIIIDFSVELWIQNPSKRTIEVAGDQLFMIVKNEPNNLLRSYDFDARELVAIPNVDEAPTSVVHLEVTDDQLFYFLGEYQEPYRIRKLDPATNEISQIPNLPLLSQSLNGVIPGKTFNVFASLNGLWYATGSETENDSELFLYELSEGTQSRITDIHQGNDSGLPFLMQVTGDGLLLVRAKLEGPNYASFHWVSYDPSSQEYEEIMPEIEWDFHSKLYQFPGYLIATQVEYEGVSYDAVAFDSLTGNYIPFIEEVGTCILSTVRGSGTFLAFNDAIYYMRCDGQRVQLYRHEMGVAGAVAVTDFTERSLAKSSLRNESIAHLGEVLIMPVGPNENSIFFHDLYSFDGENLSEIDLGDFDIREPSVLETSETVYFTIGNSESPDYFYPAYLSADNPTDLRFLTYQGDTIRQIFGTDFHQADSSVYFSYEGQVFRHHPSSEEVELYYSMPDTLEQLLSPFILEDRLLFLATTPEHGRELYEINAPEATPRRVTDIRRGPLESRVSGMTVLNDRLFFSANDGFRGHELWSYNPACFTLELTASSSNIDLPTGTVSSSSIGGTAPFTYQWNNGASTASLFDVKAGFYEVTITDVSGCSVSQFTWVETNGVISSNDRQDLMSPNITVYPNPFQEKLSLQLEDVVASRLIVNLFSLNGQLLQSKLVDNTSRIDISTSQLRAGSYVVQVLTDTGKQLLVRQVVKHLGD